MENSRENSVDDRKYARSNARENFRHLNSSNRRRVYKYIDKAPNSEIVRSSYSDREDIYNVDKVSKDFRRFLISAILVSFVVIVKILDFGFTNTVEAKLTTFLRNSSAIDSKISTSLVSLGENLGINIDEISIINDSTDDAFVNEENAENQSNDISVDENVIEKNSDSIEEIGTESTEEQIKDFYIDDEVLESVFEDEKK